MLIYRTIHTTSIFGYVPEISYIAVKSEPILFTPLPQPQNLPPAPHENRHLLLRRYRDQ